MNIHGEWGAHDAPYLRAVLECGWLGIHAPITFLLDTGASHTSILDDDVRRLGIPLDRLIRHPHGTTGIGGSAETFLLSGAKLHFQSTTGPHTVIRPVIYVLRHATPATSAHPWVASLPSLLGRDIINNYRINLDRKHGTVLLKR